MGTTAAIRIVVEHASLLLVHQLAVALEGAEMEATIQLLIDRLSGGDAIETVIRNGSVRVALKPFAELTLRDLLDIAQQPGLSVATREMLARRAMEVSGYLEPLYGEQLED